MCFRLNSYKKENVNKGNLFFLNKEKSRRKKTGIVLLIILIVLFCIDGVAYVHCKSIFPDEIMDMHGHLLSSHLENERHLRSEVRNEYIYSSTITDRFIACVLIIYKVMGCFPINNQYLLDPKERLFAFHRYNS